MNIRTSNPANGLPLSEETVAYRKARNRLFWAGGLAVLVIGATLYGFFGASKKERVRPPAAVVLAVAKTKDVTVVEHTVGTVIANATVQVNAQVTGQLLRATFREGQIVKKGDLLFEIDPRPFQAALLQAQADLAKDEATKVNAEITKRRYDTLYAQNAISQSQKDSADAAAKSAAATVEADRAEVQIARLNLSYTQIRSPVDGKTGPILIQPGNLVTANSSNALVVITQIEPVKISFALSQAQLPRIQALDRKGGLFAVLATRAADGTPIRAKIDFVSNQVSNTTGTIEMRATIPNRDHVLVPGQMVELDVALNTLPKAVVVPREAVNEGPNGRYVFVATPQMTAEMRPVTVQFDDGKLMALQGVKLGEKVVVDGQLRVMPGAKISAGKGRKPGKTP